MPSLNEIDQAVLEMKMWKVYNNNNDRQWPNYDQKKPELTIHTCKWPVLAKNHSSPVQVKCTSYYHNIKSYMTYEVTMNWWERVLGENWWHVSRDKTLGFYYQLNQIIVIHVLIFKVYKLQTFSPPTQSGDNVLGFFFSWLGFLYKIIG